MNSKKIPFLILFLSFLLYLILQIIYPYGYTFKSLLHPNSIPPDDYTQSQVPEDYDPNACKDLTDTREIKKCFRNEVVKAISHAFYGYRKYAWGYDQLLPITKNGSNWLFAQATIIDSMDTLLLADLKHEFDLCVDFLKENGPPLPLVFPTNTFEYNIRVVGGLLGIYSLTEDDFFLKMAQDTVDSLIAFSFQTNSGLPRKFSRLGKSDNFFNSQLIYLINYIHLLVDDAMHYNTQVGLGTFSLEFRYLSCILNDPKYEKYAKRISKILQEKISLEDFRAPLFWNVDLGTPKNLRMSRGDSFFEYLVKDYMIDPKAKRGYAIYKNILHVIANTTKFDHPYEKEGFLRNGGQIHHLECFIPGWLSLYSVLEPENSEKIIEISEKMMNLCHRLHENKYGLGVEIGVFTNTTLFISNGKYELRPEILESNFYLYRITKKEKYLNFAIDTFKNLQKHTRIPEGGYSSINIKSEKLLNEMPSYFIAETLKYLLLTFTEEDDKNYLDINHFVFNTEAHPLNLKHKCKGKEEKKLI